MVGMQSTERTDMLCYRSQLQTESPHVIEDLVHGVPHGPELKDTTFLALNVLT